jgi:hypothetical protein
VSYRDAIICIEPDWFLETWPPIYIGTRRGRLGIDWDWAKFDTTLILNTHLVWLIFTFKFIRHPFPPILSPSSRTFVKLTLITLKTSSFLRRNFSQKVKWEDNRTLIRLLNLSYMCWVAQRREMSRMWPQCPWLLCLKGCGHIDLSSYKTTWIG